MSLRLVILILPILGVIACTQSSTSRSLSPTGPAMDSALLSGGGGIAGALGKAGGSVLVTVLDACDPETFNAVLGPGGCVRSGGVTFNEFIAQLERLAMAGAWHFAPTHATLSVGQRLVAVNRGGEVHTFTEVEEFGGGIVPRLNELAHTPDVAPECMQLAPTDFIQPGATFNGDVEDEEEVEHYQCCIHPWMRMDARVRN